MKITPRMLPSSRARLTMFGYAMHRHSPPTDPVIIAVAARILFEAAPRAFVDATWHFACGLPCSFRLVACVLLALQEGGCLNFRQSQLERSASAHGGNRAEAKE